ncbi:RNA-directed DNA polymerase, eukaryota, reverse transcriptase zinc-binding domain protein [Tanacetum coccineum]
MKSQQEERESKQEITASGTNDKQESTSKRKKKAVSFRKLASKKVGAYRQARVGKQGSASKSRQARVGKQESASKSRQARVGKQETASKSRQARVGKQESASKRRQARVVKQETASKSRQARIDKQERDQGRQNDKRQIRVPDKLVDSYYDTKVNKTRKKSKNKVLSDEIGEVEVSDKVQVVELVNEDEFQEKSVEMNEDVENKGIGVEKPITDMEVEEMVCPKSAAKSNVSEIKDNHDNTSYANVLNQKLDNKLTLTPSVVGDDGVEDPSVCLERTEPIKLPLWVKFRNLPLEAWSAKGISAIASRLGNPLIMDQVTTQMRNLGNGRVGFARVLIEVEACKGLPDQIEIVYKNIDNMETGRKYVKVEYDWKPPLCTFCSVFGHRDEKYGCKPESVKEIEAANEELRKMK